MALEEGKNEGMRKGINGFLKQNLTALCGKEAKIYLLKTSKLKLPLDVMN